MSKLKKRLDCIIRGHKPPSNFYTYDYCKKYIKVRCEICDKWVEPNYYTSSGAG